MNQTSLQEIETLLVAKAKEIAAYMFKEMLTADEAAEYLGIKKSYLYKLTADRAVPHYKPRGKMCYFRRSELDAWLTSVRVATDDELSSGARSLCTDNRH